MCSCFESENLIETRRAGLINTLKGFAIGDNYKTKRERGKRLADGCLLFIPLSAQSTASGIDEAALSLCSQLCGFYLVFAQFDGKLPPRLLSESSRCATNSWIYIHW